MNKRILGELLAVWLATQLTNLLISPHAPGWPGIQPHPYLIPIAVVGCRYGSLPALLLAAALAGGYALLSHGASPLLFPQAAFYASCLLTAAVTGSLFDHSRARQQQLEKDLQRAHLELAESQRQKGVLETAVGELRQRILGQGETFGSLYELAQRLTTLQPEQLSMASLELACQRSQASQGHFYRIQSGKFVAMAHYPAEARAAMDPADSQLVRQALSRASLLAAPQAEGSLSAQEPLVVLPLGKTALITLEGLPFERYNPATLGELQSIADWTTRALEQVELYGEKETRLSQGHSARSKVLQQLGQRPLLEQEFPLIESWLLPMEAETLAIFREARWQPVLRENLLVVMERHPHGLEAELRQFVADEAGWVALTCRQLASWSTQPAACEPVRAYLRQALVQSRRHWLRVAMLVKPVGPELREQLLSLAGLPVPAEVLDWSRGWLPGLEASFESGPTPQVEIEELLLEALGHEDVAQRCAALQTLSGLIALDGRWAEPGPGRPWDYALESAADPDPRLRAAAQEALSAGGGDCAND